MSTHLRHQFSELFSVLFMRMNSYHPITALYYAWGRLTAENSNLMKELRAVSSFLWTWPQQYLIWQHVERTWESGFFNTHCTDQSSYLDRSKRVSSVCEYISYSLVLQTWTSTAFAHISCLLQMKYARIRPLIQRQVWSWTRWTIVIHSKQWYRLKIQRRANKKQLCLYSFCFKYIFIWICLYNECVVGLCFIGWFLPSSHPLHSHFSTVLHAHFWSLFQI